MDLVTAEGYADLELWREAWQTIDAMHPLEKGSPAALRIRLRCCAPLGAWAIGEHVANLLRDGEPADRKVAAAFFLDYARTHPADATRCISAALETWPASQRDILQDSALAAFHSGAN